MAAEVLVRDRWLPERLRLLLPPRRAEVRPGWVPKTRLGEIVKESLRYLPPELAAELVDRLSSVVVMESSLAVVVFRPPANVWGGRELVENHGITSRKVITDEGVAALVDAFQNVVELELFNYHALGTGTTAEAAADGALVTELTTQYNPDNTRATGTQSEPAANQYRSVGTNTLDAAATIQEHGLMTTASNATSVIWDRSLTGAQTLGSGDSLQSTHTTTVTSGG